MSLALMTILSVAFITFMTRYLFLEEKLPLRLGPNISQLLNFSGPAVLTAIFMPILVVSGDTVDISISNPYLWGGCAAIVAAHRTRNVYLTLVFGSIVFVGVGAYFS